MSSYKEPEHITMLRNTLRQFIDKEMPRDKVNQWDKDDYFPRDVFDKLCELGVTSLTVPVEYGGTGRDMLATIATIEEFLFGKNNKNPEATADEPAKGSLIALKDQHLEAYKANKDVEKYKKAIELPDAIIKKLEKHVEKFGEGDKGKGNKVKLEDVKGKDLPETIKKLELSSKKYLKYE